MIWNGHRETKWHFLWKCWVLLKLKAIASLYLRELILNCAECDIFFRSVLFVWSPLWLGISVFLKIDDQDDQRVFSYSSFYHYLCKGECWFINSYSHASYIILKQSHNVRVMVFIIVVKIQRLMVTAWFFSPGFSNLLLIKTSKWSGLLYDCSVQKKVPVVKLIPA